MNKTLNRAVVPKVSLGLAALLLLSLLLTVTYGRTSPVHAAASSLRVQYQNGNTDPNGTSIIPRLILFNDSGKSVSLSDVTVRYWYNLDGNGEEQFVCDYAQIGCNKLAASFVKLDQAEQGADHYMEWSFKPEVGTLDSGSNTGQIITRWNKVNWQGYKQAGHYSFDPTKYANYYDYSNITIYYQGALVWGTEPGDSNMPAPTATTRPTTVAPTNIPVPPTATNRPTTIAPTSTPLPPTATAKPTNTPLAPPATATAQPTSPPNSGDFVIRQGSQLYLSGKPFRITGANIYWLGLDENVGGVDYPTNFRVDDVLATAKVMGATVVRSHTLGASVGCDKCLMPSLGNYNLKAFERIDYAIAAAKKQGLKLIIPLTDQWHYYHGGKHTFTNWRGYNDIGAANAANNQDQKALEAHFYTDPIVISDFKGYVNTLLNHKNQYTGLVLKDEPTILAWETGNEIWDATDQWTNTVASFIKGIAPRQLVSDGSAASGSHVTPSRVDISSLDIVGGHFYPLDVNWMIQDAQTASASNKVYYVGEYDWTGSQLPAFLTTIEQSSSVSGALFWSLFGHNDNGGYVQHNDGFTIHYPGDNDQMQQVIGLLMANAYKLSGLAAPQASPTPNPNAPGAVVDNLDDFSKVYAHSSNLEIDGSNPNYFEGDNSRLRRTDLNYAWVDWHKDGLSMVEATIYFWPNEPVAPFALLVSADGTNWQAVTPQIIGGGGNWFKYSYRLTGLSGQNYVRLVWPNLTQWWNGQIGKLVLN